MKLEELLKNGVKLTEKITLFTPNLNGLVELERKFGHIEALEHVVKLEEVRYIIYVLANKKYWDGEIDKPFLTEQQIGKEIEFMEINSIGEKLRESFGEVVSYSKNSPGSSEEKKK